MLTPGTSVEVRTETEGRERGTEREDAVAAETEIKGRGAGAGEWAGLLLCERAWNDHVLSPQRAAKEGSEQEP